MQVKHEWRKKEKSIYLPKTKPELITIPEYQFITLHGQGNPNSDYFNEHIQALYSVSYAIKMTLKKLSNTPENYKDWTVYPLEGIWDITEKEKQNFKGKINKDELVFDLMIRQPSFVNESFFNEMLELTKKKKPQKLLNKLHFKTINEGPSIQMLHIGSYNNEKESFIKMEAYAESLGLLRKSKIHKEIYLSDFRKVDEAKLKTILRFQV
ncbi:GyrI-like domain-containing protein [Maribacter hydrothermalis]|uniref:GyrI-like small molecule binding domain-containing protein n=1 Tax=Maribacter hydrothermalis TaxID=1836467 RepID=A0A1B7Z853_9FLAO|nr:GyrI-like domain-containing protein [Maribacter hydrothermalis]APQ19116.1 hypothetical protein BTR34_18095 [Maribacter hydrothermalis]OBR38872.1 hypothetical protein A9200_04190 [Maribacter hydrothermalis]